jgi:hypothetical protein
MYRVIQSTETLAKVRARSRDAIFDITSRGTNLDSNLLALTGAINLLVVGVVSTGFSARFAIAINAR